MTEQSSGRMARYKSMFIMPAVIISLFGQEEINSTFINFLERYGEQLRSSNGKLFLADVLDHPDACNLVEGAFPEPCRRVTVVEQKCFDLSIESRCFDALLDDCELIF